MSVRGKNSYSIQSVDNALDILEALCDEGDEFRIAHLSERLGMQKMSVFRHLATFENRGYVEKEKGSDRYRLGLSAYEIGQKLLSRMGLLRKARPVMANLVRECDEAAYIAVPRGSEVLLFDMVDNCQQVKVVSLVGKRYPMTTPAAGRILLAHNAREAKAGAEAILASDALAEIRAQGFCHDIHALGEGIISIAVPVFGSSGKIVAALCLVGPDFRLPDARVKDQLLPRLREAGKIISSRLGHSTETA